MKGPKAPISARPGMMSLLKVGLLETLLDDGLEVLAHVLARRVADQLLCSSVSSSSTR
jgi:hypothetical protein